VLHHAALHTPITHSSWKTCQEWGTLYHAIIVRIVLNVPYDAINVQCVQVCRALQLRMPLSAPWNGASMLTRCRLTHCPGLSVQGVTAASHVERDEVKGLTYDFTMDFTARLKGLYHLFCIPDDVHQEPYLLAKIQDDPCYIHRYVACGGTSLLRTAAVSNSC
jgi:hypothetical protein